MINALKLTDPELDTSVGTVVRKILDVVSEQIAPAYAEQYLTSYGFDVDTKTGSDLDDFCSLLGIYRLPGTRATGMITFTRPTASASSVSIPAGTQVSTTTNPAIVFATYAPAVLLPGTTSVDVPIIAINPGSLGNLPAGSLTAILSAVSGISGTVTQDQSTGGGRDPEADDAFRDRFKSTVFRSMAGTEDMFLALALSDPDPGDGADSVATSANVIGSTKWWREQVQIDSSGRATSTIPASSVQQIIGSTAVVGTDIDSGAILTSGIHYTFDTSVFPPVLHSVGSNLAPGTVLDLTFEYIPSASRNDLSTNILNRVDVWVAGVSPEVGSEVTYWQPQTFSGSGAYNVANFVRLGTASTNPTVGNLFLPLAWGPIIAFPESLTIAGTTYTKDVDYFVVHDDTAWGYGPMSLFGLEFNAGKVPPANSQIVLTSDTAYTYNRLPADVLSRIERWKLVSTDVAVHAAKQVNLVFNFAITFVKNYDRATVMAGIDNALSTYLDSLGFRSVVQVSDLIEIAHQVAGVDNIRFLNSHEPATADADSWGIQVVDSDGTSIGHYATSTIPARAVDVILGENQVASCYNVQFSQRAQNTFGEAT